MPPPVTPTVATPIDAPPPDAPEPAIATVIDAAPPPDAEPFDCTEPCTEYAVCWEYVHKGRDYRGGSECTYQCERMAPADQAEWVKRVAAAFAKRRTCKTIVDD